MAEGPRLTVTLRIFDGWVKAQGMESARHKGSDQVEARPLSCRVLCEHIQVINAVVVDIVISFANTSLHH